MPLGRLVVVLGREAVVRILLHIVVEDLAAALLLLHVLLPLLLLEAVGAAEAVVVMDLEDQADQKVVGVEVMEALVVVVDVQAVQVAQAD